MIMTVTLNPAIDKFYVINRLTPYEVMRVHQAHTTAGGKGINVSRAASQLGAEVLATGFLGGHHGALFASLLTDTRTVTDFTRVRAETRTCINVWDSAAGKCTELLEPGGPIHKEEMDLFLEHYQRGLSRCETVVLSGSLPPGVPDDFYTILIQVAKTEGKRVFLDTSGPALKAAIPACPDFVKPNQDEIRQLFGPSIRSQANLIAAVGQLRRQGIPQVAISLGKDGVLAADQTGMYRGRTPEVPVVNTVGCGDCMVAGFAVALSEGDPLEKAVRRAMAAATANALSPIIGHFRQQDYERLLTQVTVEKVEA